MTDDERFTGGSILEVLDVMERHGYHSSDNQHTGQAIGLIRDVARIYEGTQDASPGGYVAVPSSRPTAPRPPGSPSHAVIVSAEEVNTLLAALDDAAEYKRDRAETCADCAGQFCTTCQWRLQAADLRPDGRPDDPRRRGLRRPAEHARPRSARQWRAARGRRQGGRTVTRHRTAPASCSTGQMRQVRA